MSNMILFGNGLQKKYNGSVKSDLLTNSERNQQKADHEALRAASMAKRAQREARMEERMARNVSPEVAIKVLEENPMKDINVQSIIKNAKSKTNALARAHGLPQPNNPEALAHDRLHCMTCDRKLDQPNNYKQLPSASLFDDSEIRTMCCWCFGRMGDDQIKSTMYTGLQADAKIRLAVYNPVESTKAEIESLIESKMIQMRSKLKRWQQDTALVGNIKHDYLHEGDQFENQVMYRAKTRYTACTL